MLPLDDRVIMISGANRGIGLASARLLAARGARLSLGARDPESIPTDVPGMPLRHAWQAEDSDASSAWVAATQEHFGRIDGIVMNAGVAIRTSFEDGPESDIDRMWDVNFKGPLRLIRAALPALRESGQGRVVSIVSLAGKRLLGPDMLGYSASKFAAMALTHAIRQAGWDDGIRATSICPGMVDTRMVADRNTPEREFKIDPDAIAETVAYALCLPDNAAVSEVLINSRLEAMF